MLCLLKYGSAPQSMWSQLVPGLPFWQPSDNCPTRVITQVVVADTTISNTLLRRRAQLSRRLTLHMQSAVPELYPSVQVSLSNLIAEVSILRMSHTKFLVVLAWRHDIDGECR